MVTEKQKTGWNELEFISWKEFKEMGPSIIRLEISILGEIIDSLQTAETVHNRLVKARYELKKFIECLEVAGKEQVEDRCAPHLINAIMNIPARDGSLDQQTVETLQYVLDRLQYVYNRFHLIY